MTDSERGRGRQYQGINHEPYRDRLTRPSEAALLELGKWWGGKLVAYGNDIKALPHSSDLDPIPGINRGYYTLVTHHTKSETSKEGIIRLGGIIYLPDSQQTLFFGNQAGEQLRASLGEKHTGQNPYGKVKDGKTFVYIHPIPYDLYDDAKVYLEGPEGFPLAKAFSNNPPDYIRSRARLEQVLQAPWELLDPWLTKKDGIELIQKYLPHYTQLLEKRPELIHNFRMTENR